MACELNPATLAAYLDGELTSAEAATLEQHVRGCAWCAGEVAELMHVRRSLRVARGRYTPDPAWKKRVLQEIGAGARTTTRAGARWFDRTRLEWSPAAIAAAVVLVLLAAVWIQQRSTVRNETFREVADLHVSDVASANPVDVVSSDRHTVKPWFAGRVPFSFNVPELAGTEFTLIGGRVVYLEQEPGAQLLVAVGPHRISVLIFRASPELERALPSESGVQRRDAFQMTAWRSGDLRFFVVSDAEAGEVGKLAELLRQANP
jgi:anti-sigma factor RsiW